MLLPLIMAFSVTGVFAVNNNVTEVLVMLLRRGRLCDAQGRFPRSTCGARARADAADGDGPPAIAPDVARFLRHLLHASNRGNARHHRSRFPRAAGTAWRGQMAPADNCE